MKIFNDDCINNFEMTFSKLLLLLDGITEFGEEEDSFLGLV